MKFVTFFKCLHKRIELQMPDTTQMEDILQGFSNVMDFHQFKLNSKNLDMIKDDGRTDGRMDGWTDG